MDGFANLVIDLVKAMACRTLKSTRSARCSLYRGISVRPSYGIYL